MPAAWDLIRQQAQRVLIATIAPPDGKVSLGWARAMASLQSPPASSTYTCLGLPFGPARNQCLKATLELGFGYLFFVDSDVVLPGTALMTLIGAGRDVIAAEYKQRFPPFKSAHAMMVPGPNNTLNRGDLPAYPPGEIIPVDSQATGATLYSRRALESLIAKFRRPFEWGLDIAPVPGDDGQPLSPFSEDYHASTRLKAIGFQPWLHTGIVGRHEFTAVATATGVEMAQL